MPFFEVFLAATAEDAAAAPLADAAIADTTAGAIAGEAGAAGLADATALGGEYLGGLGSAGAAGAQGITQAGLAADAAAGGAGAGGAGTNAAQVAAQQQAATSVANSGIPSASGNFIEAGSGAGSMDPALQMAHANIDAASAPSGLAKGWDDFTKFASANKGLTAGLGYLGLRSMGLLNPNSQSFNAAPYNGPLSKYRLSPNFQRGSVNPQDFQYTPRRYAEGGIMSAAGGGPVEQMSNNAAIGANTHYPMSNMTTSAFATPYQTPIQSNVIAPAGGATVDQNTGELNPQGTRFAEGGTIDLHGSFNPGGGGNGGGFGNNGVNGYQSAGSGSQNQYQMAQGIAGPSQQNPQMPPPSPPQQADSNGLINGLPAYLQYYQNQPGEVGSSPSTFSGGMKLFAEGGIASYKDGGDIQSKLDYYNGMIEGPASKQMADMYTPAPGSHDLGVIRDTDPDTMYLDPVTAAQVRMAKINKRANMQTPTMKRPTPMGQLNLKPQGAPDQKDQQFQEMAGGGILQASGHLGGYAAGGQPRLLKGPGDGMSDNIPAVIADKQPARLADGEFVVPADVVSHLGNGSTDAGAKKLHGMMDNVRKARTGRKAQGKQIDPNRFMPK